MKKTYPELENWNGMTIFYRLNLTPKDGWNPQGLDTEDKIIDAAKKWLKDNAGSYRVHRLVADNKKDK